MTSPAVPRYRGLLAWLHRHAVLLGLAVGLLGVIITVIQIVLPRDSGEDTVAPATTTHGPTTASPVASAGGTPSAPDRPTCVLVDTGEAAPCVTAGTALVTRADTCTVPALLSAWALDPRLDSLDLDADRQGADCWVRPGAAARSAGATAEDVLTASAGTVAPVLRECASRDGSTARACSQRHELEWVGGWTDRPDGVDLAARCAQLASEYTGMTVGTDRLVALVSQRGADGEQIRCAVKVEAVVLDGSLRNLRGGPLPLA